jgi:hypothetical protein
MPISLPFILILYSLTALITSPILALITTTTTTTPSLTHSLTHIDRTSLAYKRAHLHCLALTSQQLQKKTNENHKKQLFNKKMKSKSKLKSNNKVKKSRDVSHDTTASLDHNHDHDRDHDHDHVRGSGSSSGSVSNSVSGSGSQRGLLSITESMKKLTRSSVVSSDQDYKVSESDKSRKKNRDNKEYWMQSNIPTWNCPLEGIP